MKVLLSLISYKIEGNYLKGKIWVLNKLKTKTSFAHFCHGYNVRHFYPHNRKCQFDVKRGNLSTQVAPKISYQEISFDEASLGVNTAIGFGIIPL